MEQIKAIGWLKAFGLSTLAILAPIKMVMITVGVLVFADLVSGVWAAKKRGEDIKSAALRRTVSKLLIYQMCIITGFMVETYLMGNILPIVKLLGGLIGVVELKSVLENSNTILGQDLFKLLIQKLGSQNDRDLK